MGKFNLLNNGYNELEKFVTENGIKKFKAKEIFKWLHQKNTKKIENMTNLSLKERNFLYENSYIPFIDIVDHKISKIDKTEKYIFQLEDKEIIETVLLKHKKRNTICVSTQVGCPINCPFCATGKSGYVRNLKLYEILSQIYTINSRLAKKNDNITNIVYMGMGEPLLNYDNVLESIMILSCEDGLNISKRKITISTAGIIPGIEKIINEDLPIELAISLHAANNEVRDQLIPINKKYGLNDLMAVLRTYQNATNRKLTFEYILINKLNMSETDAIELENLLRGIDCMINLIPYNPIEDSGFEGPTKQKIDRFYKKLKYDLKLNVILREEKGADINGACGQLKRKKR